MQFKYVIEADINKILTLNEPLHTSEFGSAVTKQHTWGESKWMAQFCLPSGNHSNKKNRLHI